MGKSWGQAATGWLSQLFGRNLKTEEEASAEQFFERGREATFADEGKAEELESVS